MIDKVTIGVSIAFLVLIGLIVYMKKDIDNLELQITAKEEKITQLIAINKDSDEQIKRLVLESDAVLKEFQEALKAEREKHNATRELLSQIEQNRPSVDGNITCEIKQDKSDGILQGLKDVGRR
jgi:molecular chaperone DnaK (HSP70)